MQDDPALAQRAQAALSGAGGGAAVHDVTATSDGHVVVTLVIAKSDIGTDVQASDAGRAIASIIFQAVPKVTTVGVFDGDNKMIDIYTRK